MSDDDNEEFDTVDSGAADCYPIRAGEIKKGHFVVIKGHPCKARGRAGRARECGRDHDVARPCWVPWCTAAAACGLLLSACQFTARFDRWQPCAGPPSARAAP